MPAAEWLRHRGDLVCDETNRTWSRAEQFEMQLTAAIFSGNANLLSMEEANAVAMRLMSLPHLGAEFDPNERWGTEEENNGEEK